MYIGADYYPEHWPRERWDTDARLMKEAGFNITRLAEFSWCKLEPSEGVYDFSWLDDAIRLLGEYGIRVILCTPTPTMPKWVYDAYPETVAQDQNGHKLHFGNRQNNCFTSAKYRELSRDITRQMAQHYADNPNVIGWQLDNELNLPYCFCPSCEREFQLHLKRKFGTIGNLNDTWGTIFWSQSYRDFDEMHLPKHEHSSPSLELEFRRFHSNNVVRFAKEQADIIRSLCPSHFVTHNLMGFKLPVDYYDLSELLDFASFDLYYNFREGKFWHERFESYSRNAASLDFMRSVKHKSFLIMETTAGPAGWETYGRNVRPGELRRMAIQNMAHGADGQIWFRWRTCRFGTEQYWHGILGHDGVPARRYREIAAVTSEMQKINHELQGSSPAKHVGIVSDYDDRWALDFQKNCVDLDYTDVLLSFYQAVARRGVNVEFLSTKDSLDGYRVVVLPLKYIVTETYASKLRGFVERGGVLVGTFRSGVKNEYNVPYDMTLPGHLRDIFGIKIEEYESVSQSEPYQINYGGQVFTVTLSADWIQTESAESIATYEEHGLSGITAIASNIYGKGKAYYCGTMPEREALQKLMDEIMLQGGLHTYDLEENVELVTRVKDVNEFIFVINHSTVQSKVDVKGYEILSEKHLTDGLVIQGEDVALIRREKV